MPLERWEVDAACADAPLATPPARFGGWLANLALFDAELFGVAVAEAAQVDPQQRLLLEAFHHTHDFGQVCACYEETSCTASNDGSG